MKIDNSRVVIADVHMVTNSSVTKKRKEDVLNSRGDVFGSYGYNSRKINKDMVFIKFEKKGYVTRYVPVALLKNLLEYANFKLNPELFEEKIYFEQEGLFMPLNGDIFIKDVRPLFNMPGKISLKELVGIQKLQNDRDDTYSGGMEMM